MADICTKVQSARSLKCSMCNKVYSNEKLLFRHLYKHEHPKQFSCPECKKVFPTKTRLNIHSRIHTGDRPFKCTYCQIYFASRFQLKLHQRRHTGEKPYSCSFCEKEFSSSSGLRQHVKTHTKESPFSCNQCNKSFKQKEKLKQHERIHTGVRPFMCDQCPKTFRIKNALVRHLRIHSGDTYKCGFCPKEFGELYALKKHHRKQHDKIQFTGPSERLSTSDENNCRNIAPCDNSTLNNKVKRSRVKKNKVKVKSQNQKKRQIKGRGSASRHKLTASSSDLSKDVVEKLYLEIGQRDASAVVDENGWHRIPLSAASDLLSRNTGTFRKSSTGYSKEISVTVKDWAQNSQLSEQPDTECKFSQTASSSVELQQVTKQQGGATNTSGSEVLSTGLLEMVSEEANQQKHEKISVSSLCQPPVSSLCQQSEQATIQDRRRREITHPSTIDYFPTQDQTPEPVYEEEGESFQFLKNCEPASASYMQHPPYESLVGDLQEPDFNRNRFKENGALSESSYSKPDYNHHNFHNPNHENQQNGRSFYELRQSDGILLESDHRPKATLHHHPEPYQQNYLHDESHYYNIEPQYSNTSLPDTIPQIELDCSWHDHHVNAREATPFNENPCCIQPPHYQQASSCALNASLASFTSTMQPTLSSCEQGSLPIPQSSGFSLMPFQQSSFEVKSSDLIQQHENQLPHQNELCESNQQCLCQNDTLTSNQPFQNQLNLHQNDTLTSNQPFQNQLNLHQKDTLTSNQPFQNQLNLHQKDTLTSNQPFQNQLNLHQKDTLTSNQPFQNQLNLHQKDTLTSNQPFQNQLNLHQKDTLTSNQPFQNQLNLHQKDTLTSNQPFQNQLNLHQKDTLTSNQPFQNQLNLHQKDTLTSNQPFQNQLNLHQKDTLTSNQPFQNQLNLHQKDTLTSNQPFQNQLNLHQKDTLTSNQPFQNQLNLHQKESLISNQPFQNESVQSNHVSLQQHLPCKQLQPLLGQHESPESNQHEQLFYNYNFSARPNITNHHTLFSANTIQQTVVMFSRSDSSVIHHKPVPIALHDNQIDTCSTDTWPVYFPLQHSHSNTHQDFAESFSDDIADISLKTSTCGINEESCTNSHRQISNQIHTVKSLDLPKSASFKSVSDCIVQENSSSHNHSGHQMNLDLSQRASFKSLPDCIISENSSNNQQNDHLKELDMPIRASLNSDSECIIQGNSYFNAKPIETFMPSTNDVPRSNFSIPKKQIVSPQLPIDSLPLSNCLDMQSKTAAPCGNTATGDELLTINTFLGEFHQTQGHFVCVTVLEEIMKLPDIKRSHNSQETNTNLGYNPCKLITKIGSLSNIAPEASVMVTDKEQLFDDNDFNVSNDENDFEVSCQNSNQFQPYKQTNKSDENVLTRLDLDYQDGTKEMMLSGKANSELAIRNRLFRSECFSKYRNVSQKVMNEYQWVTKNIDLTSESVSCSSRSNKINEPSEQSFDNLKQSMLESKILESKKQNINQVSKQNSNHSEELSSSLCDKTLVCDVNCNNAENVKQKKQRRKRAYCVKEASEIVTDIKVKGEHNLHFAKSKKRLIRRPEKLSRIFTSVDEKGKFDLNDDRKSVINEETNIDGIKLLRKEYEQGIHLNDQVLTRNFDELRHECQTCGKQFPNNSRLQRHMKTHVSQKPYPCSRCPQAFTAKRYLDNHMSRHDKQPPIFACGDCQKTFPRRYQLKIHYRTHSGEKPYKCSRCSSHFATSFQVRLHERVHSDNLSFQCRFCGKCFRSNTNLSLHVKRHTNDKPYLCATCGATFYEASKLKGHIRIHTGVHPFMCDQCPKTFKVKHLLVRHLRWHNDDTFKCEHCGKPFDERWILKAHMQKHHSGL